MEGTHQYQRLTFVKPVEHHYGGKGEEPYIKYGCPVCEMLSNRHQLALGEKNCPLCSVNLLWEKPESEVDI